MNDSASVRCDRCGRGFADGEEASEQIVVSIVISGSNLTRSELTTLTCSTCADRW
jgi:hypothetical protein